MSIEMLKNGNMEHRNGIIRKEIEYKDDTDKYKKKWRRK